MKVVWNTFDKKPPENDTFLIKRGSFEIFFGRYVDGHVCTAHVFQNIANSMPGSVVDCGKPIDEWLESLQPQGPNKYRIVWAEFDWKEE